MTRKIDMTRLIRDPYFSRAYTIGTILFGLAALGFGMTGLVKNWKLLIHADLTLNPLFYACFTLVCLLMFALFLAVGLAITIGSWLDSNMSRRLDVLEEEIKALRRTVQT